MKNKITGWICGLLPGNRKYRINGVTYIVSAHFESPASGTSIRSRFEKAITSEMIDLMDQPPNDIMTKEYVCSAAGKED